MRDDEGLQTLKVGELSVWIEQGPHALLAVVVRGTAPAALRGTLQQALESVHAQYSDLLESFDGDAARFEGARPLLEACLQQQYRARQRRVRLSPTAAGADGADPAGARHLDVLCRSARAAGGTPTSRRFGANPGSWSCRPDARAGRYVVSGLRDPLARDPATLLAAHSLAADDVAGRWELYQALHPTLVLARARQLLAPPAEVNLQLQDGRPGGVGHGPDRLDRYQPPDRAGDSRGDAVRRRAARSTQRVDALASVDRGGDSDVHQGIDRRSPSAESRSSAISSARLTSLDALGRVAKRQFTVELVGEADADGAAGVEPAAQPASRGSRALHAAGAAPRARDASPRSASAAATRPIRRPAKSKQAAQPPRVVPRHAAADRR